MLVNLLITNEHFKEYDPRLQSRDPICLAIKERLDLGIHEWASAGDDTVTLYLKDKVLIAPFPVEEFYNSWRRKPRQIKLKFKTV